jgi:hypothetical protein
MAQDYAVVAETVTAVYAYSNGPAGASISVATANNTTIPVQGPVVRVSATAATTSGSCTLANGTIDTQEITLVNESTNNIIISGGMKASAAATVAGSSGKRFKWIATDTAWFPL